MHDHRPTFDAKSVFLNLAILAGFLGTEYLLVQGAERFVGTWQAVDLALIAGCLLSATIALKFHARLVAYAIAAFAAVFTAELGIHLYYGIRSVQGAPTHFAVLASAGLGVGFGALLAKYWVDRSARARQIQTPA